MASTSRYDEGSMLAPVFSLTGKITSKVFQGGQSGQGGQAGKGGNELGREVVDPMIRQTLNG
jgi:hypothetical protein